MLKKISTDKAPAAIGNTGKNEQEENEEQADE